LCSWLSKLDSVGRVQPEPASLDASFRRYFRVRTEKDSFIAMDAPPDQEDCRGFVRIAAFLRAMGLNAPRVIEANLEEGFLLLSDLGNTSYLDELRACPDAATALYADALDAVSTMQARGRTHQSKLPPYDEELLRFELSLFHDWLCQQHLRIVFDARAEADWQAVCDLLVVNALGQPQVFVHRDFHSRNLMVTSDNNPGILDFQDAVEGPLTYDLVSLLKDCYIRWPRKQVERWALEFYARLDESTRRMLDRSQFLRCFELMGVQRHLKAAGIFARLKLRDGKSRYLKDVPRTLSYIVELADRYDELESLVALIAERVSPALEQTR
jgi:aminoglycoside/choline kinase family phosphotransferase